MATFKFTPKDIYEADFGTKMRGYDKEEVDELLDDVIQDYEAFQAEVLRLQEENEFLKKKIVELESQASRPNQANLEETQRLDNMSRVVSSRINKPKTEIGAHICIRLSDGAIVTATVSPTPFYDPDNMRQKEAIVQRQEVNV